MPQIVFQPAGRRGLVAEGKNLLEAARELGVSLEAACGGAGVCGKCRVIIDERDRDSLSPAGQEEKNHLRREELAAGCRLACLAIPKGDLRVTVPEESRGVKQVVLETGKERRFNLDPALRGYHLELAPASLADPVDDCRRLLTALESRYALKDLAVDHCVMRTLPAALRQNGWNIHAVLRHEKEVVKILPAAENGGPATLYGAAIDVGTTTLAAYLCDLGTGQTVAQTSRMNPQISYGEDILARITYISQEARGLEILQSALIGAVNEILAELAGKAGIVSGDIEELVMVFNTAMHHIALGIDPRYIGKIPFVPAVSDPLDIKARDLGIRISPAAYVHSLPVEAGFVGADNVAVLIAEEPYKKKEVQLIIDIGTNGEIDLGNQDRLFSTSCATGPALEGAQIKFGMRAAPGAIERVRIDRETLEPRYKVIGNEHWYPENPRPGAKGICGSGIIDVIAGMFKAGIILSSGRLNSKAPSGRVRKNEAGKPEYVLAWAEETAGGGDIVISQADIRAVQLAKAAIYVGARYLMDRYGVKEPERVILAGAFGSYIDKENAMTIGLFPDCPLEKVEAVGNAAGDGARYALLDRNKRAEAAVAARRICFVETAAEPDFQQRFTAAIAFPHSSDPFPHLADILARIPQFS